MKSDDIKRSVRASRNERSAGDAPNMGRVARMPGTGMPKGERRRRRRGEGGRDNKIRKARRVTMLIWTWLIVGLSVGVLASVLFLWVWPKIRGIAPPEAASPAAVVAIPAFPMAKVFGLGENDGLSIAREAVTAEKLEIVQKLFRLDGTEPQAALDFLRRMESDDGPITRYRWLGGMDATGMQLEGALVYFQKGETIHNRLALLTPTDDGRWQVDFEAFARTVSPPWPEILKSSGEPATVRIYAAKDNYFNGPYADESVWECYGIASPDTKKIINAYCRKDSAQGRAMKFIAAKDGNLNRAVLEIRHDPAALPGQFEITRVLAEDWVVPETPFDTRFE